MSIASALHAKAVNRRGAKAIKEMEELKRFNIYSQNIVVDIVVDKCINIVKKHFTGWTE